MIIHKYGSKLEQASTFIDDLESQLEAAKQALENTRTHSDSEISFSNDYTTYTPQKIRRASCRERVSSPV